MNSSGSNSVRVDNVFVPEHCTCSGDWTHNTTDAAPGMYLHDDPMFCGRIYAMYHIGLVIPVIGAARVDRVGPDGQNRESGVALLHSGSASPPRWR